MPIEKDIETINSSLKQVSDELKKFAEQSEKEIKSHAKLSEETRANVDKMLTQQGELQARLLAAEQVVAKLEQGGGGDQRPKSWGEQVAESEEYQAVHGRDRAKFSLSIRAAVTSAPDSGGDLIVPDRVPGIIVPGQRRLTIRDLLSWGRTTSNSVEFVRETGFTNSADVVSENPAEGKPESDMVFEEDSAKVATIAHHISASKQVLSDAAMLMSHIDGRMRYGLKLKEELQLLKGSGVGLNIHGLYSQASSYVNPGVAVQAETAIDRLRLAMLQVNLAEYEADGIVLNPIDWAAIELTKTKDNAYLFANPTNMAGPRLWGRSVVPTQSMDAEDFLVGAFFMGAQGWDREDVSISVSTEHDKNFTKNMVTILCEERVALTVYRPEAFVKGDFSGLPASE